MKNEKTSIRSAALAAAFAAALLSGCGTTEIRPRPDRFPPARKPAPAAQGEVRRGPRTSPMPMPVPVAAPAR